ncbi:phosphomannose isomerase type II C-terminal cupin domain [Sneathiella chinensis]|uniref:Mannose-6-phosphate isomerase type II C-terminal domain-containing protein n=1 Tax=Sneathiella chinensis TaxID=349750 RepID=A0ABQ5U8I0_9PROT|nr:phosphomannose isomerase type II C-terminal cupin domain [Sneathiella chinensis]GLQ08030.1 hypothetical protein GCM10007924_32520 [Sneathiella chinensis]
MGDIEEGRAISIQYSVGDHDDRPWGSWKVTDIGPEFISKTIQVKPGKRLSLQYHHHREEFWYVISGRGMATIGDQEFELGAGVSVSIPKGVLHRLVCISRRPLIVLEVQKGDTLDEEDIVRLEDDFGRH